MKKLCKICNSPTQGGEHCFRHKPKKRIQSKPLRKKPTGKKVARNDTTVKKKKVRKKSPKTLKTKLDRIFSIYIRLRDADNEGYVTCFTSGQKIWWLKSQNGHFQSRRFNATRFHEQNCAAQSMHSNMYLQGEQYLFGLNLDKRWGEGTAQRMVDLAKTEFKFTEEWFLEKIEYYTKEVEKLKKQKGL